jgi:hypothetical protein
MTQAQQNLKRQAVEELLAVRIGLARRDLHSNTNSQQRQKQNAVMAL